LFLFSHAFTQTLGGHDQLNKKPQPLRGHRRQRGPCLGAAMGDTLLGHFPTKVTSFFYLLYAPPPI